MDTDVIVALRGGETSSGSEKIGEFREKFGVYRIILEVGGEFPGFDHMSPKPENALLAKNDNVDILVDLPGTFDDVGADR